MALVIDRKEIYRYLGYRGAKPDMDTVRLVEQCVEELEHAAEPKVVSKEFALEIGPDGMVDCGCFVTESKNLTKNLSGCDWILVMAATLGLDVDRLLVKYGKLQMTKAVVLQAASAAMIEAYCNVLCRTWKDDYEKHGLYLRPRFSPGYGDFSLECQRGILDRLDAGKQIGITLTEGNLMVPTKSVTAVIGISAERGRCLVEGCEACGNVACLYRR